MPRGLVRYQQTGDFHFLTFSCYRRLAYLDSASTRELFESALERIRRRHRFVVAGYVVMPEHVHLLVSEPRRGTLARVVQALKLSVSLRRPERPFWQARYYDFNVHSEEKRVEKLRYMHPNPGSPAHELCALGWKPGPPAHELCALGWKPGSPAHEFCALGWKPGSPAHEFCALGWKPVVRGLCAKPEEWKWSSFRHYATGVEGTVEIESSWTASRRGGQLPAGWELERTQG